MKVISLALAGEAGVRELPDTQPMKDERDSLGAQKRERVERANQLLLEQEDRRLENELKSIQSAQVRAVLEITKTRRTENAKANAALTIRAEHAEKEVTDFKQSLQNVFNSLAQTKKKLEHAEGAAGLHELKVTEVEAKAKHAQDQIDSLQQQQQKAKRCIVCSDRIWSICHSPCGCHVCIHCGAESLGLSQCLSCKHSLTASVFLANK